MSKLFTLIQTHQEIHLQPEQKLIPKEEFTTLQEASQLLAQAQEETAQLLKQTEEECLNLKEQAKEEGFQEGLSQLNEKILQLDEEIKRLHHEMNRIILPLALKAAKKIVGKELELHPETIVSIVMQAITPALQNHHVTIWVNKEDQELLEKEKSTLKAKLERVQNLFIKAREDIQPGGCVIETESGIINVQIENQWRAIEAAFEKYLKNLS